MPVVPPLPGRQAEVRLIDAPATNPAIPDPRGRYRSVKPRAYSRKTQPVSSLPDSRFRGRIRRLRVLLLRACCLAAAPQVLHTVGFDQQSYTPTRDTVVTTAMPGNLDPAGPNGRRFVRVKIDAN